MSEPIDPESIALVKRIEFLIGLSEAPFDLAAASLELVLARLIKRTQGANAHPNFDRLAGKLIADHVEALLRDPGIMTI